VTSDTPVRRYAKGDAKRREILEAALGLIADRGYRNSSLQEIADAVGLTKAGVLHYFDSREDLVKEVLRERDQADRDRLLPPGGDAVSLMIETVRHNQTVPGLVQLYSRLVVESEAPEHAGHDYIATRYAEITRGLADDIRARQEAGTLRGNVDATAAARILIAVSDGLQLQWMHDADIDMSAALDAVMEMLAARP
jgi:AcrR family transcriptional regulator